MLGKKKSLDLYENRFQFLIDNILNVVAEVDSKGVFTYINPYIYDELGYQPEEIIGRSIFELIHPDDVKKISKMLHRGIKSRGNVLEVRLKNKNNQFIWFDIKTTKIKDYENEIKIIIDLINISKRKSLEKKLQEKEENYQNLTKSFPEMQFWNVLIPKKYKNAIHTSSEMLKAIIENIPQCIYWKDTAFKYLGCNHKFIEFIGMDRPEDIIGKTNEELFSNIEMLQQIKEYENSIIQSGKPVYHIHEIWITLEGKKIWLDSNKVPILDLDETIIGFLISFEEITDRKLVEDNLQKSEEKYKNLSNELETILDVIPGMIFIKKNDMYTKVNQVFADYLQLNKEEIVGKSTFDLFPQELATNLSKDDLEVIKSGIPKLNMEETVNFPGGKVSSIISKLPYYNEKEEIQGIIGLAIDISESKKLEQELKESEEKYRLISENANDLIAIIDNDFKYEYINKQVHKKLMGYSSEDLLGKSGLPFIHPDDFEEASKALKEGFETGEGMGEARIRHKNGSYLWIEIRGKTFIDTDGIKKALLISRNITERKKAENKLKDSEEKFRNLTDQALMGIAILQDDLIKYVNERLTYLLGYSVEEMINWQPGEFVKVIHPEDRELVMEQVRKKQIGEPNIIIHYQYRLIKKNGEILWVENYSKTITYEGKPADLVSIIDITDQKRVQQKLEESEKKYRNLINNITDIIIEVDLKGTFLYVSPQVYNIAGYRPEEVIGVNGFNLIHPDDLQKAKLILKDTIKNRDSVSLEFRTLHKKGHYFDVSVSGRVISMDGVIKVIAIIRDITNKKKTELMLRESEGKYRELYENAPNAYFSIKSDQIIKNCNKAAEELLGYSRDELLNMKVFDLYADNEEGIIKAKKIFKAFLKGQNIRDQELLMKKKNGDLVWINLTVNPVLDNKGNVIESRSMVIDILKHKEYEETLRKLAHSLNGRVEELKCLNNILKLAHTQKVPIKMFFNKALQFISPAWQFPEITCARILYNGQEFKTKNFMESKWIQKVDFTIFGETKGSLEVCYLKEMPKSDEGPFLKEERDLINAIGEIFKTTIERINAEKSILTSEQKFKDLMEATPIGISMSNPAGEVFEINSQVYKIFGYSSKEDFLKIPATTHYYNPKDREMFVKSLEKGFAKDFEVYLKHKDGTPFWGSITSIAEQFEGKTIFINTFQDITKRKQAQQKLKESEENYRKISEELEMIMDHVPGLIFYKDTENKFIRVNKYVADAHEMIKTELKGKSIFDLYPKEQAQAYWDDDLEVIKSGAPRLNIEEPWETVEGSRWLSTSKIPFYNENNEIIGIIGFSIDITERKLAERKLKESEEKLKSIYKTFPVPTYTWQKIEDNLILINYNEAAKEITNGNISNFLGIKASDLYKDNPEILRDLHQCANINSNFSREMKYQYITTGKEKYLTVKYSFIPPDLILVHTEDITERKKTEQYLKESEEKYRMLVENAHDGVWAVDENDNTIFVNQRICKMFGYTKNEMIGKSLYNFLDASMIQLINSYRERRERGLKDTYNLEFIKKSGSKIYTNIKATPILGENGEFKGSFAYITDITDRKITEQHLKESEQKYRNLVETSSMGLMEIDIKKGGIIYINPRLLEIVGYTEDELVSNGMFYKAIYPDDYKKVKKSKGDRDIEFRIINKKGKVKWLSGRTLHHFNEQGELIYLRLWLQDITAMKELEDIKSNLLTRVSHEIKTPLISIKGFTDLLLEEYRNNLDKQTIAFLEKIKEGGERLKLLINRFLEATQLEKGAVILNESYENLSLLIKKGIGDLEGLIKLRNHTIHVDIPDELMIYLDKEKIQSVISNLLTNAVKYTPSGGNITINSRIKKNTLIVSVRDDGIGLKKKEITQLFRPFGKIEIYGRGWDIISDGIGLGLYLSKEIIDLHNGKIWVESSGLDKGSTFYFSLPTIRNNNDE